MANIIEIDGIPALIVEPHTFGPQRDIIFRFSTIQDNKERDFFSEVLRELKMYFGETDG